MEGLWAAGEEGGGRDPLHRGKGGDVLGEGELGVPLLDVILRRGDGT